MLSKIEKRIIGVTLSGVMVVSGISGGVVTAHAENTPARVQKEEVLKTVPTSQTTVEPTQSTFLYNVLDKVNMTCEISGYTGQDVIVKVPETIDGYRVIGIADSAFAGNKNIQSITLPEGLETIGARAFYNCYIHDMEIPNSVSRIAEDAFDYWTVLLVDGGTYAEKYAIEHRSNYNYKEHVSGKYSYFIKDITMKTCGITYCEDHSSVLVIPDKLDGYEVQEIGYAVFRDRNELKEVRMPDTITIIQSGAFEDCSNLDTINMPAHLEVIQDYAFANCKGMNELKFPSSLKSIGANAFRGWNGLTKIDIPATLIDIVGEHGEVPFINCAKLAAINVDANNMNYSSRDGILYDKNQTLLIECPTAKQGKVVIPDTVTCIGSYAFLNCEKFEEVYIPKSVETIDSHSFYGCNGLKNITVAPENKNYVSDENVLYNKAKTTLMICGKSKSGYYKIPSTVENFEYFAFENCSQLTGILFPASAGMLDEIADTGFSGCDQLEKIDVVPENQYYSSVDGVLYNKDKTVLMRCPMARKGTYTVPPTVMDISGHAFHSCRNIEGITLDHCKNVSGLSSTTFDNTNIKEFNILGELDYYTSVDGVLYSKDKSSLLICPNGKTGEVMVPSTVTSIAYGAFVNCKKITNVKLPDKLSSIGELAFRNCRFSNIELPTNVQDIGRGAFHNNNMMTSVTVPKDVQFIGNLAFGYVEDHTPIEGYFGDCKPISGFVVRGERGTKAESYAADNGFKFEEVTPEPPIPENPKVEFQGSSMVMENSLSMNTYISKNQLGGKKDVYAQMTRSYSDGRPDIREKKDFASWGEQENYYIIPFKGLAAKEMNDKVIIQIFDNAGNALSDARVDSIHDYSIRMLEKPETDIKLKTCLVDMLNYGAEAQLKFNYDKAHPVNQDIEKYQKFASKDLTLEKGKKPVGLNYYGTSLVLENNICLNLYFTNIDDASYAEIDYQDHYGHSVHKKIKAEDFKGQGKYKSVKVDTLLVSDVCQQVTCKIYNAGGKEIGNVTDSIENYCGRMKEKDNLYNSIMKFGLSAKTYFAERPNAK